MTGERLPSRMHGEAVGGWVTCRELSLELSVGEVRIRQLEKLGLPFRGTGTAKRYPLNPCRWWKRVFDELVRDGYVVQDLPSRVAAKAIVCVECHESITVDLMAGITGYWRARRRW